MRSKGKIKSGEVFSNTIGPALNGVGASSQGSGLSVDSQPALPQSSFRAEGFSCEG